ncbi:folate-binding protein YgfZ [Meridianimarinicoccus roseus]|uniref:Folate-binding protein YgfZ n=1 Tax=Meridianimarinicoccus roseus TaxID=2072018 RepID=A0A2V2LLE8_9RHOB|nr:folate-binding protein YgfZ [Meridianimarinicoccus roseus]PWR03887.1 folate-binding protein YgfZ [Meridianimarinicoccus roseus]
MTRSRRIFRIAGPDRIQFLQGLVTNDVRRLNEGAVYAAMLTPQGKLLADFFLVPDGADAILLDVAEPLAAGLFKRLSMYKLRADVTIAQTDLKVSRGTGDAPDGAFADPRHQALGWRAYGSMQTGDIAPADWDALRVLHMIPETGIELLPDATFILEAGFERLNGVDFRKGCYVGQEVTARMKHKTELRKGLARVAVDGSAPVGTAITSEGKPAGTLYTQSGGAGIAYLRFDRAQGDLEAGDARVRLPEPAQGA